MLLTNLNKKYKIAENLPEFDTLDKGIEFLAGMFRNAMHADLSMPVFSLLHDMFGSHRRTWFLTKLLTFIGDVSSAECVTVEQQIIYARYVNARKRLAFEKANFTPTFPPLSPIVKPRYTEEKRRRYLASIMKHKHHPVCATI